MTIVKLFSKKFLVYNVHSLSHISDDALKYGFLDNVSAFPFENAMQRLLKFKRGKNNFHLKQIFNQIHERNISIGLCSSQSGTNPKFNYCNVAVSSKPGENCFLTVNGETIIVIGLVNSRIKYRVCQVKKLNGYRCNSKELGITRVVGYFQSNKADLSTLTRKCVLLPTATNCLKKFKQLVFQHIVAKRRESFVKF